VVRLAVWLTQPSSRFASDEESYFQVGSALLQGQQDLFWPPVTGWLIALVRLAGGSDALALVRLAWIAMDVACAVAVAILAGRLGRALWPADAVRSTRFASLATIAYAMYLPAVSYAQFATSEIPALLATLWMLALVTAPGAATGSFVVAGVTAGVMVLTRPSLLPVLFTAPISIVGLWRRQAAYPAVALMAAGSCVIGAYAAWNWYAAGALTISTNSAYNLFIGNRDQYAEDLNLFNPRATAAQIEFRRQQFAGQLPPFTQTPAESQRLAVQWIREHPGEFARRALGRLARVFVPKTDVLELIGGEGRAGVFAPASLLLLLLTNLQWTMVLFGGVAGLFVLRHRAPGWAGLLAAVIGGAVVLCLIAISKPRYSFVFDPLLMLSATMVAMDWRQVPGWLSRADRWWLGLLAAFLLWGWAAFVVFAVTSRSAL